MGYFETIYASGLPCRAVAVYMYLHDRADRDRSCWPAIPAMARQLLKSARGKVCLSDCRVWRGKCSIKSRFVPPLLPL